MDGTWKCSTKLLGENMPIISSVSGNFSPIGRSKRPFNFATGGNTVADVVNYNGTGQIWRVHTFTGSGTLGFTSSGVLPYSSQISVLVVAGGGGGGAGSVTGGAGGSSVGGAGFGGVTGVGTAAGANTASGGGGSIDNGTSSRLGGNGGSGIVYIRFKV